MTRAERKAERKAKKKAARAVAQDGEPVCPQPGCGRVAGFGTDRRGEPDAYCFRHRYSDPSHPPPHRPRATPRPKPAKVRAAGRHTAPPPPAPAARSPFARRLTGPPVNTTTDPLLIVRTVLVAGRSAGLPLDAAWPVAAEAALSYLSRRNAEDWWVALDGTATAWASAYTGERSRLAELRPE